MGNKIIKGYKGFDKDMKCRGLQYEIGKEVFASIYDFTIDRINFAKYAVDAADALIAELKKGGCNEND